MWRCAQTRSSASSQFSARRRGRGHDRRRHALGVSAVEFLANRAQLSLLECADHDSTPPIRRTDHRRVHQLEDRPLAEGVLAAARKAVEIGGNHNRVRGEGMPRTSTSFKPGHKGMGGRPKGAQTGSANAGRLAARSAEGAGHREQPRRDDSKPAKQVRTGPPQAARRSREAIGSCQTHLQDRRIRDKAWGQSRPKKERLSSSPRQAQRGGRAWR